MTADIADLETLWHSHHARLLNYARHHIDYDQAEDVVQTVYLKACEAISKGNGFGEHGSGWLYRIAHNLIIDLYRARTRMPELVELDAPANVARESRNKTAGEEVEDSAPTPDQVAEQTLLCSVVHGALNALSDRQRFVIQARMDGYGFDEIGSVLGCDCHAARATVTRVYATLRSSRRDMAQWLDAGA